jgi:hypothetical protein
MGRRAALTDFGQTEIQYLGVPALGDEQIRRFDVAMNDAAAIGRIESVGDFDGQVPQLLGFERTARSDA